MANTIRVKRRAGSAGAPSSLWSAELAYNEFSHILYVGEGTGGAGGTATQIIPIGGSGAFTTVDSAQSISGAKTFTSNVAINAAALTSSSSTFGLLPTSTTVNLGASATTLNLGATTGTTIVRNDLQIDGDFQIAGTTQFIGNTEVVGILSVDSGAIETTVLTASIFDNNATTLNIGGDATTISVGAATGKITLNNANTNIAGFFAVTGSARVAGNLDINGGTLSTASNSLNLFNTNATTVTAFQVGTDINIGSTSGKTTIKNANTNISGFLAGTDARFSGDIAINGGDLTSTSTTFNFAGTSTSVNIGATSGTTTVRNNFHVNGSSTFGANTEFSGSVTVGGDLTVNGTFTSINSTVVTVDDKNLELGSTASPSDTTANGGGITLKGTSDKTIIWDSTNANWTSSENWNIASGKTFKINNVDIVSATGLGSTVVSSSLTSVGTITSGIWHGSTIDAIYGGTGFSSYTKGDLLWANSGTTLSKLGIGTYDSGIGVGQFLQVGADNTVVWSSVIDGGTY